MLRAVFLSAIAGCGRIAFDPVALGHDEDGDGVRDIDDVCPHLADPTQDDGDGDGVGDACDPNPTVARETLALFATMMPGDQPLATVFTEATFEQRDDSLELVGLGPQGVEAHLEMPLVVADVRLAIGFDILDRLDPSPQNQFALGLRGAVPFYYVELNESFATPEYHLASITLWDGTGFSSGDARIHATLIHPGSVFFQTTQRVGTGVRFEVAWPDEPYVAEVTDAVYQGGTSLEININDLHVEIRWLVVITSS